MPELSAGQQFNDEQARQWDLPQLWFAPRVILLSTALRALLRQRIYLGRQNATITNFEAPAEPDKGAPVPNPPP